MVVRGPLLLLLLLLLLLFSTKITKGQRSHIKPGARTVFSNDQNKTFRSQKLQNLKPYTGRSRFICLKRQSISLFVTFPLKSDKEWLTHNQPLQESWENTIRDCLLSYWTEQTRFMTILWVNNCLKRRSLSIEGKRLQEENVPLCLSCEMFWIVKEDFR